MKRYFTLFLIVLMFGLTACQQEENLDKEEVLAKAVEAINSLNGYSIDMNMNVDTMGMENTITANGNVTHDPDTMHLNMSMGMAGMSMDFETYANEETAYMSMFGEWFKMSEEEADLDSFDQLNKEEMEKLQRFSDEFQMEEKDDSYVLTLVGGGDQYSPLIEELVQSSLGEMPVEEGADILSTMTVNQLELEITIDKKTFIQTGQNVNADLEIEEDGTTTPLLLKGQFTISNINQVDPIEIPQEVIDRAVSEDEYMEGFKEEDAEFFDFGKEMSPEEIQEQASYTVPKLTHVPEGYSLIESMYDESMSMAMFSYEKDEENGFMLSINPIGDDAIQDDMFAGEKVTVQGNEADFYQEDEWFYSVSWEQEGLFVEIIGSGSLTREEILEIAENIQF
jgi:hypothetical protein